MSLDEETVLLIRQFEKLYLKITAATATSDEIISAIYLINGGSIHPTHLFEIETGNKKPVSLLKKTALSLLDRIVKDRTVKPSQQVVCNFLNMNIDKVRQQAPRSAPEQSRLQLFQAKEYNIELYVDNKGYPWY